MLGTPHRRLLRRHGRPRRQLPRPRARRRPARRRPDEPAALRRARRRTSTARSRQGEFDLLGRLNRLSRGRVPRRPGAARPHQVVRAGLPHADGRARGAATSPTRRPRPQTLYGLDHDDDRGPSASSAWRPGGWSSAASASCRSSTAATAAPARGTPTATSRQNHAQLCAQVDQPIAGLLKDLKQRGLLDETLVVWATEFGRTPGRRGRRRPRPPPLRLLRLAGRRRHQGRHRPRRDRRARLPRRRGPPLRHRHPRHRPAPARPRPAPARGPRPQAAGDRLTASRSARSSPDLRTLASLRGARRPVCLKVRAREIGPRRTHDKPWRVLGSPLDLSGGDHALVLCAPLTHLLGWVGGSIQD